MSRNGECEHECEWRQVSSEEGEETSSSCSPAAARSSAGNWGEAWSPLLPAYTEWTSDSVCARLLAPLRSPLLTRQSTVMAMPPALGPPTLTVEPSSLSFPGAPHPPGHTRMASSSRPTRPRRVPHTRAHAPLWRWRRLSSVGVAVVGQSPSIRRRRRRCM